MPGELHALVAVERLPPVVRLRDPDASDGKAQQIPPQHYRLMPGIVAAVRAQIRAVAESGATSVTPLVLHLRPGAREWFTAWLGEHHPRLVERYERMYAGGSYAPTWYQRMITRQVHELAAEFGIGPGARGPARPIPVPERPAGSGPAGPTQLSLL